jgi:YHS domain-containing protein
MLKKSQYNKNFSTRNIQGITNEMVQDPVCKVYIPKKESLTTVHSGTAYFFCSKECLEKFISNNYE